MVPAAKEVENERWVRLKRRCRRGARENVVLPSPFLSPG